MSRWDISDPDRVHSSETRAPKIEPSTQPDGASPSVAEEATVSLRVTILNRGSGHPNRRGARRNAALGTKIAAERIYFAVPKWRP